MVIVIRPGVYKTQSDVRYNVYSVLVMVLHLLNVIKFLIVISLFEFYITFAKGMYSAEIGGIKIWAMHTSSHTQLHANTEETLTLRS